MKKTQKAGSKLYILHKNWDKNLYDFPKKGGQNSTFMDIFESELYIYRLKNKDQSRGAYV